MDYLKGLFNQYIYSTNRSDEVQESIDTLKKVKIVDEKIGNVKELINLLNELIPVFFKKTSESKKKMIFTEKMLTNKEEIGFILHHIEKWNKKHHISSNSFSVEDVITNTNMNYVYQKMLLVKERFEIIEEYSNKE